MNEETLRGIENELHNMNLNILELIKTIKETSAPRTEISEKVNIPYDPSIDPFATWKEFLIMKDIINCIKSVGYGILVALGVLSTIGTFVMGVLMVSVCEEESQLREREKKQK